MSNLSAFYQYAQAFELSFLTNDWSFIEPYFCEDAYRTVENAGFNSRDNRGREDVIAGLRASVDELDRRFDVRIPEIVEGPYIREDGVWMLYRITNTRSGLPDLVLEGEHMTRYRDGKIVAIEEVLTEDGGKRSDDYYETYGEKLKPSGSSPEPLGDPARETDQTIAIMDSVVRCYSSAISEQDVVAAMSMCHLDFSIDFLPFGICTMSREDSAAMLERFFESFPNFTVKVEGIAVRGDSVCSWGTARMTFVNEWLDAKPTGKTVELPIFSVFQYRDGFLSKETIFMDMAILCRELETSEIKKVDLIDNWLRR